MTASKRAQHSLTLLVFGSVLSSTLLIPAVRPFMALRAPGNDSATHAFMALSLAGAVVAAPFVSRLSRASRNTVRLSVVVALLDAAVLCWLSYAQDLRLLLGLRALQGALNLTLLSLLLGAAPAQDGQRLGARYGWLGAAMMSGVALGAPLGSLCLRLGASGPLRVGALLELAVAAAIPLAGLLTPAPRISTSSLASLPWRPMLWAFAERSAVGLFVVTFALHARNCLGISDEQVGWMLSAFMVPFVLATYPAGAISDRFGAEAVAIAGLTLYGCAWLLLTIAGVHQLVPLLMLLGVSSAAVFAAGLRVGGSASNVATRIAAMSALNSAGSLGMLCGTAAAGIISAALRSRGAASHSAHELVLQLAGATQLLAAALTAALFLFQRRSVRLVRS